MQKKTKIIATLGPASSSRKMIKTLFDAGMNVARINFSHAEYEHVELVLKRIRSVSKDIAIILDTKGPEIRTGKVNNNNIILEDRDEIILTKKQLIGTPKMITINYSHLYDLKPGNVLLIDDGMIEIEVLKKIKEGMKCIVNYGGILGSKKTVSIRGHNVKIPFLSDKDKKDILFGVKHDMDFVAASFVRKKEDVIQIKALLKKHKSPMKIIAKIEHWEALENIEEIVNESDGVMVARGDLGVEVMLEKVPGIQREIIRMCNAQGKPVIVATQMLESMRNNPKPTRAEVGDVAQAILQGTDAVMLSAETAAGKYPEKSVRMMARIAREYDAQVRGYVCDSKYQEGISLFLGRAAFIGSQALDARLIMTPSRSGFTPRNISRFKPLAPIIAITNNIHVYRQLMLSWGVFPVLDKKKENKIDNSIYSYVKSHYEKNKSSKDDKVIITAGYRSKKGGKMNLLEIYSIKEILKWKI